MLERASAECCVTHQSSPAVLGETMFDTICPRSSRSFSAFSTSKRRCRSSSTPRYCVSSSAAASIVISFSTTMLEYRARFLAACDHPVQPGQRPENIPVHCLRTRYWYSDQINCTKIQCTVTLPRASENAPLHQHQPNPACHDDGASAGPGLRACSLIHPCHRQQRARRRTGRYSIACSRVHQFLNCKRRAPSAPAPVQYLVRPRGRAANWKWYDHCIRMFHIHHRKTSANANCTVAD
eukprot:COSAG02_NODE_251_length_27002_cov_13.799242_12_plen_238_part_00